MIQDSVDIATHVSPNLAALIGSRIGDPDADQPVTLGAIRAFLTDLLPQSLSETERLHHFDLDDSLLDEIDALIEQFGGDALAMDFARSVAMEGLSRVIEAMVNDENRENPPTLEAVKESIASGGLTAKLVGEGVLDEDEDDALLAEVEALIRRYGADSLAEEFLRYE
jgi:hypothetical protein